MCKNLREALADRLAIVHFKTLVEAVVLFKTLLEVEAMALVDAPVQTPQETLTQVKSEPQFDSLAKRLSKCSIRQLATHCQR